jgi:hypothetical protein
MIMPGGRPTKLTPEVQQEIGQNIIDGLSFADSAEMAGITYETFNNWMKEGKTASEGIYFQFFQYIKTCEMEGKKENIRIIREAGRNGNWPASAWLLERRYPDEFGRKDRLSADLNNKHSGQIKLELNVDDCSVQDDQ